MVRYLFIIIPLFIALPLFGQTGSQEYARKYRVIAFKTGSPDVISVSNTAEIIPAMQAYVPNTFTPNGDGLNDQFSISTEGSNYFHLEIFNRWGELIFTSTNPEIGWDGTFQGTQAKEDTYAYRLEIRGVEKGREVSNGTFMLIR